MVKEKFCIRKLFLRIIQEVLNKNWEEREENNNYEGRGKEKEN
jgi:hypothetical protein